MWPFFRKAEEKRRKVPRAFVEPSRKTMQFPDMIEGLGKLDELGSHDTAFKFWLPEAVFEALVDVAFRNGDSVSQSLRQFFVLHCYGLYAYICIQDKHPEIFRDMEIRAMRYSVSEPPAKPAPASAEVSGAEVSGAEAMLRETPDVVRQKPRAPARQKVRDPVYWVPDLGKNVWPVKVWIARRLRDDLQSLADHAGIPVSQYAREIVISRLLGHGTLPKRPKMLEAAPLPSAEAWGRGEDVPHRVATDRDEYCDHDLYGTATCTWSEEEDEEMRAQALSKGGEAV